MKNQRAAFTLVELLINVSIIMAMTGIVASLWTGVERMARTSAITIAHSIKSQNILRRLSKDIRHSIRITRSDEMLLRLIQLTPDGVEGEVIYRIEDGELVRQSSWGKGKPRIVKVASLNKDTWLNVSFLSNGLIRLEMKRKPRNRPLDVRPQRLVTFVGVCGAEL